jgi:hypothetical protein
VRREIMFLKGLQMTPIQEEVSTDRREKSDKDLKLNKKKFEENNPHNTFNDLHIVSNNSTKNITKHPKRI